jgi:AcrR family transcriptional regulator
MPRSGPLHSTPARRSMSAQRREELLEQLEQLFLAEGFKSLTVDEIASRLRCSKSTLYGIASSKEQLVVLATKHFFRNAAATIEEHVAREPDPTLRVSTYLIGVGTAMRRHSPAFYRDMVEFPPTADVYRRNSQAAAHRVRELIDDGVSVSGFRRVDGRFAAQLVALAIDGIQSGELLDSTGLSSGDAFTELGDLLLHGLAARDAQEGR